MITTILTPITLFKSEIDGNIIFFKSSLYDNHDVQPINSGDRYTFENTWFFLSFLPLWKFFIYRRITFPMIVKIWWKILKRTLLLNWTYVHTKYCVKRARIRSFSGLYFLSFGMRENTEQKSSKYDHFSYSGNHCWSGTEDLEQSYFTYTS